MVDHYFTQQAFMFRLYRLQAILDSETELLHYLLLYLILSMPKIFRIFLHVCAEFKLCHVIYNPLPNL